MFRLTQVISLIIKKLGVTPQLIYTAVLLAVGKNKVLALILNGVTLFVTTVDEVTG